MIKAIFFDAAGILYKRTAPTEAFALELLSNNGFENTISAEKNEILLSLRSQANGGKVSHETYWDLFLMYRGVKDPNQRKDFYKQIVAFSNNIDPVPGAKETLESLKEKGLLLGIITDTMYPVEWKMKRLEKAGVASYIDIVSCSTELGAHKPNPIVYEYAIQQTNFNVSECAFVGHLGVELEGARSIGMLTIAIDQEPSVEADFFCNSITDITCLEIFED